jgi:outer membrane lipoprotein SlyB
VSTFTGILTAADNHKGGVRLVIHRDDGSEIAVDVHADASPDPLRPLVDTKVPVVFTTNDAGDITSVDLKT